MQLQSLSHLLRLEIGQNIIEFELDADTINGTFVQGETVRGISTVTDQDVTFTPYSIVTGSSITNSGAYYTVDQTVNLSATGSQSATAKVQTVTVGQVDEIIVDDAGTGYQVGDNLVLDNSGTDGSGAVAQVSVVGGAIAPEGRRYGMDVSYGMSATDHITLEETSQSFYQDTYEGTKIVLETAFNDITNSQTLVLHHNQMKLQMLEWSQEEVVMQNFLQFQVLQQLVDKMQNYYCI